MKSVVLGFGLLILALLILFSLPGLYDLHSHAHNSNWIAGFSLLFLAIGIVLSRKLFIRTRVFTADKPYVINPEKLLKLGISKREAEILLLIRDGLSNQQIADKLFLSEHTIKKHISNIFHKLRVDRRTEAVQKALELSMIG